jgi:hypothetical protein
MSILYGFLSLPLVFVLIWLFGKLITWIEPIVDEWFE